MKVLVLGATGFIGFPTAQAFVRNGHEVFGQTRSADKVKALEAEEIIPVVADPTDATKLTKVVEGVDVVVDCIGGMEVNAVNLKVLDIISQAAKSSRGSRVPKLTYIYSSGTWMHGEDRENLVNERTVPNKAINPLVSWRFEREQTILASTAFDAVVIRPSLLYGRSASILAMLFGRAQPGQEIKWFGTKGGRWSLIHVDDLANMYLRIAEAAPICKGLIFDAANDLTESVDDVLEATAKVTGASGWSYAKPENLFEEAVATSNSVRPSLARSLVGWKPVKAGLVDGIKTYYAAWKASV